MKASPVFIALTVATLAGCSGATSHNTTPGTPPEVSATEPSANVIPALNPVDVYGSLEQRGFAVEKLLVGEELSWACTQDWEGVKYSAEVFGPSVDQVAMVRAHVMADGVTKTAEAGKDFLAFIASAPYEGSEPQAAHDWVVANYDQDGATTQIGGVTFTIKAPSSVYRLIHMVPA